jgi:putative ABC transport system ATP-binding protein
MQVATADLASDEVTTEVQPAPVVSMQAVSRVFDSTPPVHALRAVDLTIESGEHVAIVGPSGSGKSTLLNVLGLLDRPTSGTYLLDGIDAGTLNDGRRAGLRSSRIGFVFQSFHLLSHRSALENVMMAGLYRRHSRSERRGRALDALERVGLAQRAAFQPNHLSGGERQRVAVARALASDPGVLLCDEPTGNLDSTSTGSMLDLFDTLVDGGLTIIMITHDRDVAERAGRRVEIIDGRLTEL